MNWTNLGLIFEPLKYSLPNNCLEFAQSPQALVLSDRVRVFFSTRERDAFGKYLSHIAFVDFDKDMQTVMDVSRHHVIDLGSLGCFDEHGIFPINVLRDGDRVLAYTTGWSRRVSVSADAAIGLAISQDDGWSFQKLGTGPIMAATLHEPFLVADAYVIKDKDLFHMWYIFGIRWKKFAELEPLERVYKIAHATSVDGIHWQRNGQQIIADKLDGDECQALPTIFQRHGTYHMYFCYRDAHGFRELPGRGYRIGYAKSNDGINWTRDDNEAGLDITEDGWDSEMQCYPHVFELNEKTYMLYNGNKFGRYGFGLAVLSEEPR